MEHFEIKRTKTGQWSVTHVPSGDTYQLYNCDFDHKRDAVAMVERLLKTDADWSSPEGAAGMPGAVHRRVWAACYAAS